MACLELFLEWIHAMNNTGSNFQHPHIRDHLRSCSRKNPGDVIETTRQSFFDNEKFWTLACNQLLLLGLTGSVPFCLQTQYWSGVSFVFHSVSEYSAEETKQNKIFMWTNTLLNNREIWNHVYGKWQTWERRKLRLSQVIGKWTDKNCPK